MVRSTDVAGPSTSTTTSSAGKAAKRPKVSAEEREKNRQLRAKSPRALAEKAKYAGMPVTELPSKMKMKSFTETAKEIGKVVERQKIPDYQALINTELHYSRLVAELKRFNGELKKVRKSYDLQIAKPKVQRYLDQMRAHGANLSSQVARLHIEASYSRDNYPYREAVKKSSPIENKILDEIRCLYSEHGKNLVINLQNRTISYPTGDIILYGQGVKHIDEKDRGVNFGPFRIFFHWVTASQYAGGNRCMVTAGPIIPWDEMVRAGSYVHPHIADYDESVKYGHICMGNGGMAVQAAINSGRIVDAMQVAESVISMYYEGSPYKKLYEFMENAAPKGRFLGAPLPRRPVPVNCPCCNTRVMDNTLQTVACACGRLNCQACLVVCATRHTENVVLCKDCSWRCSCGKSYCNSTEHETYTCQHRGCGKKICGKGRGCLNVTTCCQKTVCTAHAVLCRECRKPCCITHLTDGFCKACSTKDRCSQCLDNLTKADKEQGPCQCKKTLVCLECSQDCVSCDQILCGGCSKNCTSCEQPFCSKCIKAPWICAQCSEANPTPLTSADATQSTLHVEDEDDEEDSDEEDQDEDESDEDEDEDDDNNEDEEG